MADDNVVPFEVEIPPCIVVTETIELENGSFPPGTFIATDPQNEAQMQLLQRNRKKWRPVGAQG